MVHAEAQIRGILPCCFSLGFLPTCTYTITRLFSRRTQTQWVLKADLTPEVMQQEGLSSAMAIPRVRNLE